MDQDSGRTAESEESLAAKIQLLEDELVSLKQHLQAKHSLRKVQASAQNQHHDLEIEAAPLPKAVRHGQEPKGAIFDENWVMETLKYLVKQQNPNSIPHVLAKVGGLLQVREISLWGWDAHEHKAHVLVQWADADIKEPHADMLRQGEWLVPLLLKDSASCRQLQEATPLVLMATDPDITQITEHLRAIGIYNTLIIPCSEQGDLRGFMTLQRDNPRTWHPQDTKALSSLLGWLFRFIHQHEQLRILADRDTRYQYAMEATNDGLWDWNLRTNKIYFSRSYLRMLGYGYEALPGDFKTLCDYFVHPDDVEILISEYQTAVENRRESLQLQFRMLHRDGHALWVYSKAKFFEHDAQGRPTRCVGVNTDITDFIQAREELLHAKAQADLANKTKSEFLARVSHEIRTPMNAIIGIGYLMQDTALNEQQQSYLTSINSAADSLLQIINQLLDFSKIEAGRVILEYAHFDLEQLFAKMSRLFEISALHRAVEIIYSIDPDVPRFLRGDASRLSQILGHLISNAFQYSNTNRVVVKVRRCAEDRQHTTLEFTVEDNGLGMTAEKLAQVQSQLVANQLHESDRHSYGLGICSHLVHSMQGIFSINSAINKGCRVVFTACFEHSHLGEKNLISNMADLHHIRALIVDDNTIARTIIASTARSIHLHVDEVDNPAAAIERIRQADNLGSPYHFVLLDYRMPSMSGLQLTGIIKSDRSLKRKPHIFLISAYHRDEIFGVEPSALLIDEFLSKPVSESRLFDAISEALGRDSLLQDVVINQSPMNDEWDILSAARVLVAEDNIVNQQVICGILKKKNIISVVATNGNEAIRCIDTAREPFDAVLMDLEMPEMDGIQATEYIRTASHQQDVPIIAVTAQAMRGDRDRCLAAGMNGYLSKPVNPELLYSTLADVLRNRKAINKNFGA